MNSIEVKNLLDDYFCKIYPIEESEYEVEWIEAKDLIIPQRLDLTAKYLLASDYLKHTFNSEIKELYIAHLSALTYGTYTECGKESYKNTKDAYIKIFYKLIDSLAMEGVDAKKSIIPVGKRNVILDGAHRVAASAALGLKVPIVRFSRFYEEMDENFLRSRYLDEKYIATLLYYYKLISTGEDVSTSEFHLLELHEPFYKLYFYAIARQFQHYKYKAITEISRYPILFSNLKKMYRSIKD